MPKTFRCSYCGEELTIPNDGTTILRCSFCSAMVLVPKDLPPAPEPEPAQAGAAQPDVSELAEIMRLVRIGQQAEAAQRFSELYQVSLDESAQAVAVFEQGKTLLSFSSDPLPPPEVAEILARLRAGQPVEPTSGQRISQYGAVVDAQSALKALERAQLLPQAQAAAGQLSPAELGEMLKLLRANRKIDAIERYRKLHGGSLTAAKEAVEALEQALPLTAAAGPGLQGESLAPVGRGGRAAGCITTVVGAVVLGLAAFLLRGV